jgi:hypothetical protein
MVTAGLLTDVEELLRISVARVPALIVWLKVELLAAKTILVPRSAPTRPAHIKPIAIFTKSGAVRIFFIFCIFIS